MKRWLCLSFVTLFLLTSCLADPLPPASGTKQELGEDPPVGSITESGHDTHRDLADGDTSKEITSTETATEDTSTMQDITTAERITTGCETSTEEIETEEITVTREESTSPEETMMEETTMEETTTTQETSPSPEETGAEDTTTQEVPTTPEETGVASETDAPPALGACGLKKGATVVFTGDSIVDCYRGNYSDPTLLGRDYNFVTVINKHLQTKFASDGITVYNTGIGGSTIQDVKNRIQSAVYDLKPDYVFIMLGVNNAWTEDYTIDESIETYKMMLQDIVKKTGAQLFVMTPYLMESPAELFGGPLDRFVEPTAEIRDKICRMLASLDIPDLTVIHTQTILEQLISQYGKTYQELTLDYIHPSESGYGILTQVIANTMGIADFPLDYEFDFSAIDAQYGLNGVEKRP